MEKVSKYSNIYKKDSSVNTDGLTSDMDLLLSSLDEVGSSILEEKPDFGGFVITSAKDSHYGKNSYHNFGKAVDLSIYDSDRKAIPNWTSGNWGTFKEVINKANSKEKVYWYLLEGKTNPELDKLLNGRTDVNAKATGADLHFHIEFNPGRAKQLIGFNLPDKRVDIIENKVPEEPLYFLYQEDGFVKFRDLIKSNALFKNYLKDGTELDKDKCLGLLNYAGSSKVSNYERVLNSISSNGFYAVPFFDTEMGSWIDSFLTEEEFKEEFKEPLDIPICNGQTILLPPTELKRDFIGLQSEDQVFYFDDFSTFISEKRRELEKDENYIPTLKIYGKIDGYSFNNQVNNINSEFSVWVYCKKLNQIVDISKYCKFVTENSNSFNLVLSYLDRSSLLKSKNSYEENYDVVLSSGFKDNTPTGEYQEGAFYGFTRPSLFHEIISQGDIVFIRFETLGIEKKTDESSLEINGYGLQIVTKEMLPEKCYDLIGLVDLCSQSEEFVSDSFSVEIGGTSLSGIFEKDVSLFLPIALVSGSSSGNLVFGSSGENSFMRRLFVDGSYGYLWNYGYRTIEDTVKFYLNQLASSAIITEEEDLFGAYPNEKITKVFELLPKSLNKEGVIGEKKVKGIYQIIKVDIDKGVGNRTISDSCVSNPEGSIDSLFRRLCRFPLVEYFTDTYGDTFHIVIRKPPFDQSSILSYLDYISEIGSKSNELEKVPKFVEISSDDVETEELSWNTDFYTWFWNNDIAFFSDITSTLSFLPIVFLQEYCYRWGSRPLQYSNPYLKIEDGKVLLDEKGRAQIVSDMVYVLESNLYLPFTRRGTITLRKGERRIKKGTWIKYSKTNELYYVDSVSQNASISDSSVDRTTVLEVSRGMVITYLKDRKVEGVESLISYFRIVDLESFKKKLKDYSNGKIKELEFQKDLSVNKEVFDFFLKRNQIVEGEGIVQPIQGEYYKK